MNCTKCNTPLELNARFCPVCGEPVVAPPRYDPSANYPSQNAPNRPNAPYQPPGYPAGNQQQEPFILRPDYQPQPPASQWSQSPAQSQWSQAPQTSRPSPALPQQSVNYPVGRADPGKHALSSAGNDRPRRRGRGCLVGFLITLVVVLVLVTGGWFLLLRPYIDNMVQSKLNAVLDDAVNHVPSQIALLPSGTPVMVPENVLNNLLVLGSSPNDLVKNTQIHITSSAMTMQFDVFGFTCMVSGVPMVDSQGQLFVSNVTVQGIASFVITADELTTIVNNHLKAAQAKLNHKITSVQLKNQELDMVLGSSSGGGGGQPGGGGLPPGVTPPVIP